MSRLQGCLWALLLVVSGAAAAQEVGMEPAVAVIELYIKGATSVAAPDYSRSLAYSLSSTGRYAVMERDEVAQRFKAVLITPIRKLQAERLEAIERLVREGDQLVYTDPKAAVEVLSQARAQLESIAEGLAANERLRTEFLKTQMLLARSHLDSGNEVKAEDSLREVIRIYGDTLEVTERDYHPRLVKLFQKVKSQMGNERKASLSIESSPPGCDTLLDGRLLVGETPREYRALYPGTHHVQVRCGGKESMIHRVTLKSDEPTHLVVDVGFENALTVENGRLGLIFDSPADAAASSIQYAAKFGSLVNADLVLLHGFLEMGSRAELKAKLIDVKQGVELRAVSVPAKTDVVTPSSVKKIVQVLAATENVRVADTGESSDQGRSRAWYRSWLGWTLTGVGVAALAASGGLFGSYLSHRDSATEPWSELEREQIQQGKAQAVLAARQDEADKAISMRNGAVIAAAVGGALVAGGVVVFILNDKGIMHTKKDGPAFAAVPFSGGAGVAATFAF